MMISNERAFHWLGIQTEDSLISRLGWSAWVSSYLFPAVFMDPLKIALPGEPHAQMR